MPQTVSRDPSRPPRWRNPAALAFLKDLREFSEQASDRSVVGAQVAAPPKAPAAKRTPAPSRARFLPWMVSALLLAAFTG